MARKKKNQKNLIKDIAIQRIEYLFRLAEENYGSSPQRSDRYVALARRIGMRYRVRLPSYLKRRICKDCHSFLVPGSSSRIRLHGRYMTITCLKCGKEMRYPYKSENKIA
ncbi:ribonuclease P protein component 4 [Methanococcoides methylutens]|uniref:Ribonuclease P protein component 4 n=1 Tax=Methanococcoides methylutens MM1 TaxID=1434104 RepID=A0A0E3X0T8_METMT|nr:ribonuclease P protein component 4 [Methanococcoides methylutens]AKB86055.1 Ribonuclease P protein component 4 [Methanococcoides methylutens MM1]